MSEWKFVQDKHCNFVSRAANNQLVEVNLDKDLFEFDTEQGRGYDREHISFIVPLDVVVQLLHHAGYRVLK